MSAIEVVRLTPAEFHAGMIPSPGEPPVLVEGIEGEEGFTAIDEEIAWRLAEDAQGERPKGGSYEDPLLGMGRVLRGYRMSSKTTIPEPELRRVSYKPFSRARLGKGEVVLSREDPKRLDAEWQAELCFNGIGVVAEARAKTKYSVSQPLKRPWVVTRSLSGDNFSIEPNKAYEGWVIRNSINARNPDR